MKSTVSRFFALAGFLIPAAASAQGPAAPALVEEGQRAFAEHCASCHGVDAEGSDMGPSLTGTRRLRSRSFEQLRSVINQGRPSTGMPAFHLPARELDALATFVVSLNSAAAESGVPGTPLAGREFFFGKGQCGDCHMVRGKGKAVGPDLSNVGREMTAGEILQELRDPSARIAPGYEMVTVELRDGRTIRGFARGRTNFDIQVQTPDGQSYMLQAQQIAAVRNDKQSLMKPVNASPTELRDLVAYLGNSDRIEAAGTPPRAASRSEAAGIDFARIQNPRPGDWLTYNGSLSGNRYSGLKEINTANVGNLAVKWVFPIDHFGLETTPLVADGVMYITGPNQAVALDAQTGRQVWKYSRPLTPGLIGDASLGTNRGVALLGDKVFMVTDNAHLIALNRITGSLVWDIYMPEEPQHYGSTVAPLPIKDTIIAGVSGGDRGIRGFLACYKASTGERLWRIWTIPFKGDPGGETWKGKEPQFGGGATWLTGAYDPDADTLFWPTGNPWPDSDDRDRPGDNLFTNCILALDPATGKLKWHYQFTPHDVHDWDATEPPLLVDANYAGEQRKLLLHADRNGFFYVLDRTNGKVLLAKQFVRWQTWTQGIGSDGRPLPPPADPSPIDCPSDAANWDSAAYSPVTRLFYVLTMEQCRVRPAGDWKSANQKAPLTEKILRAIDIDTGKVTWEIPFIGPVYPKTWPGVMATAGGLVFYGDPNGAFAAADARAGKTLWHFPTNVYMKASPMTYSVGGKQFVATVAGPNIISFALP
jgi:PQQ-dependent dehydrogenase (methanol/ethanol family)